MTKTIGAIVSSPRKLRFTLLSGKLTLGPLGSVPKQQLHVIMSAGLGNPTLPFSLTMLRGLAMPRGCGWGGGLCALIPQGRSMEVTTTLHFRAEVVCEREDSLMWFLALIGVDGWDPLCSGKVT